MHWFWKLFRIFMAIDSMTKSFPIIVPMDHRLWYLTTLKIRLLNVMEFFQEIFSRYTFSQWLQGFIAFFCFVETLQTKQCISFYCDWLCAFWIYRKCRIAIWNGALIFLHDIATFRSVCPKWSIANVQLYGFRIEHFGFFKLLLREGNISFLLQVPCLDLLLDYLFRYFWNWSHDCQLPTGIDRFLSFLKLFGRKELQWCHSDDVILTIQTNGMTFQGDSQENYIAYEL